MRMKLSLSVFICCSLTWTLTRTSERPNCHECDDDHLCNCSARNLQYVPIVPANVLILDVSSNEIESITQKDLAGYTELRALKLQKNKLTMIHEEAFHSQSKLEELDLSFNNLQNISSLWFSQLRFLKHLNILGNQYTTLGSVALFHYVKNPALRTLQFGNPSIKVVKQNILHKLRQLDELTFIGGNLKLYEEGSFQTTQPIKAVFISLQGLLQHDPALVSKILRDVSHPKTSLTIRDVVLDTSEHIQAFKAVKEGRTRRLTFQNASTTDEGVTHLLKVLDHSLMSYIGLEDIRLRGQGFWQKADLHFPDLHMMFIRNIEIQGFFMFYDPKGLALLLKSLTKISVINSTVFVIPCATTFFLYNLEYLDLSQNLLSDITIKETLCNGNCYMHKLKTFNVSHNSLKSLRLVSELVSCLHGLTALDVSHNDFLKMPQICNWPASLRFLNLSATRLHAITSCLPPSLTVLDLSQNYLTAFHHLLPNLTELWLTGNRFISLPEGGRFPSLQILLIQSNTLNMFNKSDLMAFQSLRFLEAGQNHFICSCDFIEFFKDQIDGLITLRDGRHSYVCDSPFRLRDRAVDNARLSVFECHMIMSVSILCSAIVLVLTTTGVTCYRLHVLWYVQMTVAWLKAKGKPVARGERSTTLRYDAFVSYCEHDAEWVEEILVPELESSEPALALCLHKRDFLPGRWIVDNIIESIESSYRTLFILSQSFVKSEWCRYELNFSHFRIIDEHNDSAVLILLEPIIKETVPKRFCKLRRIMNSTTYLEWPQDEEKQDEFWRNLRAALQRHDY